MARARLHFAASPAPVAPGNSAGTRRAAALSRRLGSLLLGALALGISILAPGCATDAVGVETCRQVENARCAQAPNCNDIDLGMPVHRDSPKTDVDACIRFYHDACLHGLATDKDPGAVAAKACIDAINTGDCAVVTHPEQHPSCVWLVPPVPPAAPVATDAATDASAVADAAGQ